MSYIPEANGCGISLQRRCVEMPRGDKTLVQFPFDCPDCQKPAGIYGGRFNVSEQITVRYRTCPNCQKQFVTNIQPDGLEIFRHWVKKGRGGRCREIGLWGSKQECWRGLLRAIYYELKIDNEIDEDTLILMKLCKGD